MKYLISFYLVQKPLVILPFHSCHLYSCRKPARVEQISHKMKGFIQMSINGKSKLTKTLFGFLHPLFGIFHCNINYN